jgi:hypothetical protein
MGSYPHQKLLQAYRRIHLKKIIMHGGQVIYTEKNRGTLQEGTLPIDALDMNMDNVTNMPEAIAQNKQANMRATGKIFGSSPIELSVTFHLDSTDGKFDASGRIQNVSGAQINTISVPLSNTEIGGLQLHDLQFRIRAEEMTTWTDVRMLYQNLSLTLKKRNAETGVVEDMNFLSRVMNRQVLVRNNPENGMERKAEQVRFLRLTTQSFFAVLWKSIFAGMQEVFMKT